MKINYCLLYFFLLLYSPFSFSNEHFEYDDWIKNKLFSKNLINKIPSGNLGTGEDVSNCVAFLASDMANYINGETVHVNGGMYMA